MAETKKTKESTNHSGTPSGPITKIEGVRLAMRQLGDSANVNDIQAYVKKHFGLEMSKDHIYVSKGEVRKQALKKGHVIKTRRVTKRKPKLKAKVQVHAASTTVAPKAVKTEVVSLEDLHIVRSLITRIGATHLRSLIEFLDK